MVSIFHENNFCFGGSTYIMTLALFNFFFLDNNPSRFPSSQYIYIISIHIWHSLIVVYTNVLPGDYI